MVAAVAAAQGQWDEEDEEKRTGLIAAQKVRGEKQVDAHRRLSDPSCALRSMSSRPKLRPLTVSLRNVCLSVCLSVCLPACLSVCLSVCLCLQAMDAFEPEYEDAPEPAEGEEPGEPVTDSL